MDMQFIFGNPKSTKKSALRKKRSAGKIKGRGLTMKKKKKKVAKKHTSSKKHASSKKHHKKGKGKRHNPYQAVYVKHPKAGAVSGSVKTKRGPVLLTGKESTDLKSAILQNKKDIQTLASKPHNTLTSSDKMKLGRLKSRGKKLKKLFTSNAQKDFDFKAKSKQWLSEGFEYLKSDLMSAPKGGSSVAKKAKAKKAKKTKKAKKAKTAKKHTAKKHAPKKHVKKAKKHKAKKKHSKKRSRVGKSVVFKRKGAKARLKWKKDSIIVQANPKKGAKRRKPAKFAFSKRRKSLTVTSGKSKFKLFKNPGGAMKEYAKMALQHNLVETGELFVGGAAYKTTNLLMAKYGKMVYDPLLKVPVIGEAMPSLFMGALLNVIGNFAGSKVPALGKGLKFLGTGLVSASVVTMGAASAQTLNKATGLLNGLEGDFQGILDGDFQGLIEGDGDYELSGLLEGGSDFGDEFGEDFGADFGNDFGDDDISGEELDGILEGDSMC